MNKREIIFEYILQHGIDDYALKTMLRIRREELSRREPFFECVEIGGLCELLSYMCGHTVTTRRIEARTTITDKTMLTALILNIVNRLPSCLQISTAAHKNCLAVILRGNFYYEPNIFEQTLLRKLNASLAFMADHKKSTLVIKLNRSLLRPTAKICAEEMLLNPLSDAYVFLHNIY